MLQRMYEPGKVKKEEGDVGEIGEIGEVAKDGIMRGQGGCLFSHFVNFSLCVCVCRVQEDYLDMN